MKKLISFIPHPPAFESSFPVLDRLHARGNIAVEAIVGSRFRKTDPRVLDAFEKSGMRHRVAGPLGLEVFSLPKLLRADAVLAHTDPIAYRKKERPRDWAIPKFNVPLAFIQHGMAQYALNYTVDGKVHDYYAQKMLIWDALPAEIDRISTGNLSARSDIVGFQKKNMLSPFPGADALREACAPWEKTVLICHNFGWSDAHGAGEYQKALAYMEAMVQDNPKMLFILRSHRGRVGAGGKDIDQYLSETYPNVMISDRHSGLSRFAGLHDILPHVDCMLSHPSTAILDAVYEGIPVGLIGFDPDAFGENGAKLAHLPVVDSRESGNQFLRGETWSDAMLEPFHRRYGADLDANIDRAAEAVEKWMSSEL